LSHKEFSVLKLYCQITILVLFILQLLFPVVPWAREDGGSNSNGKPLYQQALPAAKEGTTRSILSASPREIDLGEIGPEDAANGMLTLKNLGGGSLAWSTHGPEGWERAENQELTGRLATDQASLRLSLKFANGEVPQSLEKTRSKSHRLSLTIEAGGSVLTLAKNFSAGTYREPLRITSAEGTRTVFLNFKVTDGKAMPSLDVEPMRLDFGSVGPGKQLTKQIKITNKGRENVKWRFIIPKPGDEHKSPAHLTRGRYVSFFNDESKGGGNYLPAGHLRDNLEVSGRWSDMDGYPSAYGANTFLRYRFSGTGIGIVFRHSPDGGQFAAYMDDQLIHVYDGNAPGRGREEVQVIQGLPEGQHVLTIVNGDGRVIIEGVNVLGKELLRGNPGWLSVSPNSGTTSRETDYANLRLDTQLLPPGLYGEQIILSTNRGDVVLEAYVEVKPDQVSKYLDVYRYVRNLSYFYTSNPQAEANRIQNGRYRKEGIAFRLFAPGTPGTTEFYRWYNAKKDDYYYSYVANGGKPLKDYAFEGTIGHIATSRLSNTKELYRWYNPETGCHFYTTDEKGNGITKKGYKFDGIAGYVR